MYNIDSLINEITQRIKYKLRINEESEGKFRPTTEWMTEWYNKMNSQLFGGQLGNCVLSPFTTGKGSNGGVLGWFKMTGRNVKYNKQSRRMFKLDFYGNKIFVDNSNFVDICCPVIELNGNYSATHDGWLNTLVHEMCHYYTYMNGFYPVQSHGREFRSIAQEVAYRSNGAITIQRLASAEKMQNFELDSEIVAKNTEKLNRKKSKMLALVVITAQKQVRLILTTSTKLISEIGDASSTLNGLFFGMCNDVGLINFLFEKGYRSSMRKYRFWDITDCDWLKTLANYEWEQYIGKCDSIEQALGIEDTVQLSATTDISTDSEQQNSEDETNTPETTNKHLGYEIISDGNGFNLINGFNKKTFKNPVTKIWFDENRNQFFFTNGKFTYCGTPGNWTPYIKL